MIWHTIDSDRVKMGKHKAISKISQSRYVSLGGTDSTCNRILDIGWVYLLPVFVLYENISKRNAIPLCNLSRTILSNQKRQMKQEYTVKDELQNVRVNIFGETRQQQFLYWR